MINFATLHGLYFLSDCTIQMSHLSRFSLTVKKLLARYRSVGNFYTEFNVYYEVFDSYLFKNTMTQGERKKISLKLISKWFRFWSWRIFLKEFWKIRFRNYLRKLFNFWLKSRFVLMTKHTICGGFTFFFAV